MPKVIEIQIGRGIEGIGQLADIKLEELLVQPLDLHPVLEVLLEAVCMEGLEFIDAVLRDIPTEYLLVDVGKKNAGGELGEIPVPLDQRLGVEDDGLSQIILADLEKTERRRDSSICSEVMQRSRPMEAKDILFLRSIPSQKKVLPSFFWTTIMESCLTSSSSVPDSRSMRRRAR